jgi:hypothetical protein
VTGLAGVDPDPEVGQLLGRVRLLGSGSMPFGPRNTRRQLRKQRSMRRTQSAARRSEERGGHSTGATGGKTCGTPATRSP